MHLINNNVRKLYIKVKDFLFYILSFNDYTLQQGYVPPEEFNKKVK